MRKAVQPLGHAGGMFFGVDDRDSVPRAADVERDTLEECSRLRAFGRRQHHQVASPKSAIDGVERTNPRLERLVSISVSTEH